MINNIIEAISIRLHALFPSSEIYPENIEQGLSEDSFLIMCINPSSVQRLGNLGKWNIPFDILFFPAGGRRQMNDTAEKLFANMDPIDLMDGTSIHASSMRYEITDNVLHFFVNYNTLVLADRQREELMDDVELKEKTNEI